MQRSGDVEQPGVGGRCHLAWDRRVSRGDRWRDPLEVSGELQKGLGRSTVDDISGGSMT